VNQRKHTVCSHCGWVRKNRYLELMWRLASRGAWHYVGGWFCAPCRHGFIAFIEGLGDVQLVDD
jgi:hypothetical protein